MSTVNILILKQVQLEVCPFCQKDAGDIAGGSGNDSFVRCSNCAATGPKNAIPETACNLWNGAIQSKVIAVQAGIAGALTGVKV